MKNVHIIDHPIIRHSLCILRDKNTESSQFRRKVHEISRILAFEATRDLVLTTVDIETPLAKTKAQKVTDGPVVVSIMRAGNGMLDGLLSMMPFAAAGHIGIYRDKFIKNTVEYYFKMPKVVKDRKIFLADPLLATGDTMVAAIDRLKQYEVGKIIILTILSSQYGIDKVLHFHPDVEIYTTSIEPEMDQNGYLIPGLGDAGDRLYKSM